MSINTLKNKALYGYSTHLKFVQQTLGRKDNITEMQREDKAIRKTGKET